MCKHLIDRLQRQAATCVCVYSLLYIPPSRPLLFRRADSSLYRRLPSLPSTRVVNVTLWSPVTTGLAVHGCGVVLTIATEPRHSIITLVTRKRQPSSVHGNIVQL